MRNFVTYKRYLSILFFCFCFSNVFAQEELPIEWKALNGLEYHPNTGVLEVDSNASHNQWHVASSNNFLPGNEDGYISFIIDQLSQNAHVGLSYNPYDRLQSTTAYGVRLASWGQAYVYENGASTGAGPSLSVGDTIIIHKVDSLIRYKLNGTIFKTSTYTSNRDMWPVIHTYGVGNKLKELFTDLPLDTRPVFWQETSGVTIDNSGHVLTPDSTVSIQNIGSVVSEKNKELGLRAEFSVPTDRFMNDVFAAGLLNSESLDFLSDIDYGFYSKGDQTIDVIRNGTVQSTHSILSNQNLRIVSSTKSIKFYLDKQLLHSAPAGSGKYRIGALFYSTSSMPAAAQIKTSFPMHIPNWEVQQKVSINTSSNTIFKSATTLAWDAYSISPKISPANREFYLEAFITDDRYKLFGIAEDSVSVSNYQDFLYCFFVPTGGNIVYLYKQGAPLVSLSASGGNMLGHRLSMFVDKDVVLFYLDDVIVYRDNTYNWTEALHVGAMIYENGSKWNGIQYEMKNGSKNMELLSWEDTGGLQRSISKILYKKSNAIDGWSTASSGQFFSGTKIESVHFSKIKGLGSKTIGVGNNRLATLPSGINYRYEVNGNLLKAFHDNTEIFVANDFSEQDVLSFEHSDGQMHYLRNGGYLVSVPAVFTNGLTPIAQLYSGGASIGSVITNLDQSNITIPYTQNVFNWVKTSGADEGLNKVIVKNYNDDGAIIQHTVSYTDGVGKEVQAQIQLYDILLDGNDGDDITMVSQALYDDFGRPIAQSLPALGSTSTPIYQSDFYDVNASSSSPGRLKHYYSDQNQYLAASGIAETDYPYSKVTYYNDLSGRIKTQTQPGDKFHVDGKEQTFFYGRSYGELRYAYGGAKSFLLEESLIDMDDFNNPLSNMNMNFSKTISQFDGELEQITYTDASGNLIASCVSGEGDNSCELQTVNIGETVRADIHLPEATRTSLKIVPLAPGFDLPLKIIDRDSGNEIVPINGLDDDGNSVKIIPSSIPNGTLHLTIYNAKAIEYDLDYTRWTINYYDGSGRLTRTVPPEAIDCSHVPEGFDNVSVFDLENPAEVFYTAFNDQMAVIPLSDNVEEKWTLKLNIDGVYSELPGLLGTDYNGNGNFSPSTAPGNEGSTLSSINIDTETGSVFTENSPEGLPGHTREMPNFLNPDDVPWEQMSYHDVTYELPINVIGKRIDDNSFEVIKTLHVKKTKRYAFFIPIYDEDGEYVNDINQIITYYTGGSESEYSRWVDIYGADQGLSLPGIPVETPFSGVNKPYGNHIIHLNPDELDPYKSVVLAVDSIKLHINDDTYMSNTKHANIQLSGTVDMQVVKDVVNVDLSDNYKYDEKGQLIKHYTPDQGLTKYVYNKLGQLRFSQNAQQKEDNEFAYFAYDKSGRIKETGVFQNANFVNGSGLPYTYGFHTSDEAIPGAGSSVNYYGTVAAAKGHKNELPQANCVDRNFTVFDDAIGDIPAGNAAYIQKWTAGNVSKTYNDNAATWYSYNELGQLTWMLQEIKDINTYVDNGSGGNIIGKVFRLDYEYDDLGRVVHIAYQKGIQDEELHYYYSFDNNGNLASVWSNPEAVINLEEDGATLHASYTYYPDGSLKNKSIANDLQSLDYVYTINGWLKSVNDSGLNTDQNDVFGFTLDYFKDDYRSNDNNIESSILVEDDDTRFSGLVAAQRWKHKPINGGDLANYNGQTLKYNYSYNKQGFLNQAALSHSNAGVWTATNGYKVTELDYDKNGNITALKRLDSGGNLIDNLSYIYNKDVDNKLLNNQLKGVNDVVSTPLNLVDYEYQSGIEDQYEYNKIGQMTKDLSVGDDGMITEYNHLGLVKETRKIVSGGPDKLVSSFAYNEKGQRLCKTVYDETGQAIYKHWYVYDVSGKAIAIYKENITDTLTSLEEMSIFGLQRLGTAKLDGGNLSFAYELKDHVGNVRTVISRDDNNELVVNYLQDYYPFGMEMEGRSFNAGNYRYGYQGEYAEKDQESGYNSFQLRQYDPRLGRWMKTDPYYQYHSPYMAMGNNPVSTIDPTGGWGGDPESFDYFDPLFVQWTDEGGTMTGFINLLSDNGYTYDQYASQQFIDEEVLVPYYSPDERATQRGYDIQRYYIEAIQSSDLVGWDWSPDNTFIESDNLKFTFREPIKNKPRSRENLAKYFSPVATIELTRGEKILRARMKQTDENMSGTIPGWNALRSYLKGEEYDNWDVVMDVLALAQFTKYVKVPKVGCFTEGTLIQTEYGSLAIEDIKVGDLVWSYNEITGVSELKAVEETYTKEDIRVLYSLTIGEEEIMTTSEHPFYINGEWIEAEDLNIGDEISYLNDKYSYPLAKKVKIDTLATVYNFSVESNHNYYVSELGVLVHNNCGSNATKGSIWSATKSKTAVQNAFGHFKKHAAEFPEYLNAKQYVQGAKNFLTNSPKGTLTKVRPNGDIFKYHPGTNTFGVMNSSGVPRTMFRPTDGMKYWLKQ